jgi:hypothetical protein
VEYVKGSKMLDLGDGREEGSGKREEPADG